MIALTHPSPASPKRRGREFETPLPQREGHGARTKSAIHPPTPHVLLLVWLTLILSGCQPADTPPVRPPEEPVSNGGTVRLPEAQLQIQEPALEQKDEQGRTLWKLTAKTLRGETGEQGATGVLEEVRGWLYQEGKPTLEFTARYARAHSKTREVEAWGEVQAVSKVNGARLSAERIVWNANTQRVRASGGVKLIWEAFELREQAIVVDTALEQAWGEDSP